MNFADIVLTTMERYQRVVLRARAIEQANKYLPGEIDVSAWEAASVVSEAPGQVFLPAPRELAQEIPQPVLPKRRTPLLDY